MERNYEPSNKKPCEEKLEGRFPSVDEFIRYHEETMPKLIQHDREAQDLNRHYIKFD